MKPRIIRITTVPLSLRFLLKGQLAYMGEHFEIHAISSGPLHELDEVRQFERVTVHQLEMTRLISPISDLCSLWLFVRICKRLKPTIVHSHTPKAGIVGMLGAWIAGVPIRLHTVAGLPLMETKGLKRELLEVVEKLTYCFSTKVYPNSKGLYEYIVKHNYASAEKLKVIANGSSNGIDTSFFSRDQISVFRKNELRIQLGIQQSDFVFIYVGRLVRDKGINELVKAFLAMGGKQVKLLLVGSLESDLDPLLEETLIAIEKNPNIISVGFQLDVRPYLAIAQVLTFPSYREGFPNVVMQAGAMDLPVIASDINGCNEIVIHGQNGLLIPVKDEFALQASMEEIRSNIVLYRGLTANARAMIVNRFEQKFVWERILEEYQDVLEAKGIIHAV